MARKRKREEERYRWVATLMLADGSFDAIQFEEFLDLSLYLPDHYTVVEAPWHAMISYGEHVNIPARCNTLHQLIVDVGEIVESGPDWNDITFLGLDAAVVPSDPRAVKHIEIAIQRRTAPAKPQVLH